MAERTKSQFVRVRKDRRCPRCDHDSWCMISEDGSVCLCMRVESQHPKSLKSGDIGWIHRLSENDPKPVFERRPVRKKIADVTGLALEMASHREAERKRYEVAKQLGVSVQVLRDLWMGIWWDEWNKREVATFPSWGDDGTCRGIIMRYSSGKKLTVPGSSNSGCFITKTISTLPGPVFIVEGPTDVAAFASVNLCAIGRPSNVGGKDIIIGMIRRYKLESRSVIVVSELDFKEHHLLPEKVRAIHDADCQTCRLCAPGVFGAIETCKQLEAIGVKARWAVPVEGCKDGREMMNRGRLEEWLKFERVYDSVFCPALDIGG